MVNGKRARITVAFLAFLQVILPVTIAVMSKVAVSGYAKVRQLAIIRK